MWPAVLKSLHWLPFNKCIAYTIFLLAYWCCTIKSSRVNHPMSSLSFSQFSSLSKHHISYFDKNTNNDFLFLNVRSFFFLLFFKCLKLHNNLPESDQHVLSILLRALGID